MVQIDHAVRAAHIAGGNADSIFGNDTAGNTYYYRVGGTSFNTTEPAPILELEPTVKEPSTLAPLETTTLSPIVG